MLDDWEELGKYGNSFFRLVAIAIYDCSDFHERVRKEVVLEMMQMPDMSEIMDQEYVAKMIATGNEVSELEIYVDFKKYDISISL